MKFRYKRGEMHSSLSFPRPLFFQHKKLPKIPRPTGKGPRSFMSLLLMGFQEVFDFLFSRPARDESYQKPCASLSSMDARRQDLTAEVFGLSFPLFI